MDAVNLRPRLVSFRTIRFHGENKNAQHIGKQWSVQLTQTVEVALMVADEPEEILQAVVKIELLAKALKEGAPDQTADFVGGYEAKYSYPLGVKEIEIAPKFEHESYRYVLAAQAFPLAMTHFRREMQSMGFDARQLPLGI